MDLETTTSVDRQISGDTNPKAGLDKTQRLVVLDNAHPEAIQKLYSCDSIVDPKAVNDICTSLVVIKNEAAPILSIPSLQP